MSEAAKESVIAALRLSAASAEALDAEIERNIRTARAELLRVGVAPEVAESDHDLVISAVVAFCQMTMGSNERHERYLAAWLWQAENLRKSTLTLSEEETEGGEAEDPGDLDDGTEDDEGTDTGDFDDEVEDE